MSRRRPKRPAPEPQPPEPEAHRWPAVAVVYDERGGYRLITLRLTLAELREFGEERQPDALEVVLGQAQNATLDGIREARR